MRYIFTLILLLTLCINISAQSCPAVNETFATSALIDPNWTFGCTSGTSCSGGTTFDNRTTCQATTTMDACAPSPSCGTLATNASDLWFKFYATATTAVVSVNPSVSMKSAAQVFSVNQSSPTCASLVEIGCAVAGSVSSGSLVNLSGLTVGNLYFYRVFGSASNAAQRTGTFCFCGSSGLSSSPLAANIRSFAASKQGGNVLISWSTNAGSSAQRFDLEKSFDGVGFNKIGSIAANGNSLSDNQYDFIDLAQHVGKVFYRLKTVNISGQPEYSRIVWVNLNASASFILQSNIVKGEIWIDAGKIIVVQIVNSAGVVYLSKSLQKGINSIDIKSLPKGIYFIKNVAGEEVKKFIIQ